MRCDQCGGCMTNTQSGVWCDSSGCPNSYGGATGNRSGGLSVPAHMGELVMRPRPDIAVMLGFKPGTDMYNGRTAKGRARRS